MWIRNSLIALTFVCALTAAALFARADGIQNPITQLQMLFQETHPGYVASNWYRPMGTWLAPAAGTAASVNVIGCLFGGIDQRVTLTQAGTRVSIAGNANTAGTGNVQIAIYSNVNSKPGLFLSATTSSMSTTAAATVTAPLVPNIQVGPGGTTTSTGNLWFCANSDSSGASMIAGATGSEWGSQTIGSSSVADLAVAANIQSITCTGAACTGGSSTFGSWPATLVGSTWTATTATSTLLPLLLVGSVP